MKSDPVSEYEDDFEETRSPDEGAVASIVHSIEALWNTFRK